MKKSLINAVDDGDCILITGGAGVGKTYHTNKIIEHLRAKQLKFAVCAMTGLASQHLHFGMTVHRFLQLGGAKCRDDFSDLLDKPWFIDNLDSVCHVSTIIIDEVSMMRTDFIELLDEVLKYARIRYNILLGNLFDAKEQMAFGGYQLIFVGDFCQLPPVVKDDESPPCKWIFQHPLFKEAKFRVYNLTETKRTSDPAFANTLNKIRVGYCDQEAYDMIWNRSDVKLDAECTVLMSRVDSVRYYNLERLKHHDGEPILFSGNVKIRDEIKDNERLAKLLYRASISESGLEKDLNLKVGCKVMILANNADLNYSNGSQGILLGTKKFDELSNIFIDNHNEHHDLDYRYYGECLHILLDNGYDVVVPKRPYNLYGAEFDENMRRKVDATFYQYPVTLGYAVSIHKSQGMSLDNMILDCKKIFAEGQFYVGLSRARSLEGLSLLNFHKDYIKADNEAVEFYLKLAELEQGEIYE